LLVPSGVRVSREETTGARGCGALRTDTARTIVAHRDRDGVSRRGSEIMKAGAAGRGSGAASKVGDGRFAGVECDVRPTATSAAAATKTKVSL
jgi:hypothetical protein